MGTATVLGEEMTGTCGLAGSGGEHGWGGGGGVLCIQMGAVKIFRGERG